METEKIVLHVVGRMDIGGAESRIMDLYRHIDREKVQFYFVQHTTDRCAYESEIEALGGKVFSVSRFKVTNLWEYKKAWKQLFEEHPEIQVVHGHMTSTASIYLPLAKKAGVPITIAHARSAGVDPGCKGKLTKLLRRNLWKKSDYLFTCSGLAGEAVFGKKAMEEKKVTFIPNAIAVDQFQFDYKKREEIRYELGLQGKFVIGHVGRFSPMKNHPYLLQILQACMEIEKEKSLPQTMLLFVGDGPLREEITGQAISMGISSRVLFLGNKKEVWNYYQAMDYFLLPSFYEGLPGTAIEAQASGLPGLMSDTVTPEAILTPLLQSKDIRKPAKTWALDIMKEAQQLVEKRNVDIENSKENAADIGRDDRTTYAKLVKAAGFDVKEQAKRIQEFYLNGEFI